MYILDKLITTEDIPQLYRALTSFFDFGVHSIGIGDTTQENSVRECKYGRYSKKHISQLTQGIDDLSSFHIKLPSKHPLAQRQYGFENMVDCCWVEIASLTEHRDISKIIATLGFKKNYYPKQSNSRCSVSFLSDIICKPDDPYIQAMR